MGSHTRKHTHTNQTVTVYMQRGGADAHLPARRPSGHADDEGLPVRGPIPGRVTWHCLAVSQHASSAGRCVSLTHGGAVPLPSDAAAVADAADEMFS